MSAFIVGNETINKIVNLIGEYNQHDKWALPTGIREYSLKKIGQKMLLLNIKSVDGRYKEKNAIPLFKHIPAMAPSKIVGLKALRCLLYQCAEDDAIEDPFFETLEKFAGNICYDIVRALPAYDNADWG